MWNIPFSEAYLMNALLPRLITLKWFVVILHLWRMCGSKYVLVVFLFTFIAAFMLSFCEFRSFIEIMFKNVLYFTSSIYAHSSTS